MNLRLEALSRTRDKYQITPNKDQSVIRRNLLFVSLLSLASLIVSPKNGFYSINLGVVSGEIKKPELLFIGLTIICIYQLYHFWLNQREAIFNFRNFNKIIKAFIYELASKVAHKEYYDIIKQFNVKNSNFAISNFEIWPTDKSKSGYSVYTKIESKHLDSDKNVLDGLNKKFDIEEVRGFYQIKYEFEPSADDYLYLSQHRSQFVLTCQKDFIEYALPFLLGMTSVIFLIIKTLKLIC